MLREAYSMSVRISGLSVFLTAPDQQNLVILRMDTTQPGLYGLGCGSFAYRAKAVKQILEDELAPLLIGREVSRIEDVWQLLNVNAYWRNGPVLNSAISAVDTALWDIKGKMAGMPLYDLLGGKCRERVDLYCHCNAANDEAILEKAHKALEEGFQVLRVAYSDFDGPSRDESYLCLRNECKHYDPRRHMRSIVKLLEKFRIHFGEETGLITDTHERLSPTDAVSLAKMLEPLQLYFMEDPVSPENLPWLERLRQCCATPIAIGEVFSHPFEWKQAIENRWTDFIRCHLSAVGGLTPARKIAALCELYGVKTAWHAPLDTSPVSIAVQTHLDYASPAFGIQEYCGLSEQSAEVFPGLPVCREGALWLSDAPGHGVSFDETAAKKYPPREGPTRWTEMRWPNGGLHTP